MNDPALGNLAITILLSLIVGVPSGLGIAMLWFRNSKRELEEKDEDLEAQMKQLEATINAHAIQLSILTTSQDHIKAALVRIENTMKERTDLLHEKIDELIQRGR